jgi:hypothetical protein
MRCCCALAFAVALASLSAVSGQPPIEPKDGKYTVPLSVEAIGPARPALKYRLMPELREMQTGNQITAFYKCFFEQNYLFHNKESTDKQQKWNAAPLKDLANQRELIGYGGAAVKQAHYAARLDTVNWELTNQAKSAGVGLLLPDVQQMRMLTAVLKVRFRGELARGEFDNAVHTLQTMFTLARTFNEHPTLIGQLVGLALASITLQCVEEFIQQPGVPNLFWALTDLPTPFIDLRKGREMERMFLPKEYDVLRKAAPVTEAELQLLIKNLDTITDFDEGKKEQRPSASFAEQLKNKDAVSAATARLKGFGHKPGDLAKLSPLQLLMMDDFAQYQAALDDYFKWTNVPAWQVPADLGKKPRSGPFSELLPAFQKVLQAKFRVQQVIALLMVAEGVRAHAAANGGKLPTTLDVVKLPLPADPVTGKPFLYELKGGKAVLRGTPPAGREDQPSFNRVYEITVRK